jgi:hypothetical protein
MTTLDLTPLFRTAIGFDRLARVMPEALKLRNIAISGAVSVPGGRTESRLTQAVAGLGQ